MDWFTYEELKLLRISLETEIIRREERFDKDSEPYKKKAEYEKLQEKVEKMIKIMDSIPVEEN